MYVISKGKKGSNVITLTDDMPQSTHEHAAQLVQRNKFNNPEKSILTFGHCTEYIIDNKWDVIQFLTIHL